MPEIKRILLPLVFSEHDTYAAEYARQIALCAGAEVDLVHVTPEVDFVYGHEMALQALHKDFKGYEKEVADKLMTAFAEKSLAGVAVGNKVVLQGNPFDEIINYATHNDIQMIIIATHCRKGLEALTVGSVAERVIKGSSIPVLAVHPPCRIGD
ncbi:universal stress protein [Desulfobulbus alkaliphilus]|uniref:universal stress protein n=1 Tax=Desulfobulbus alkaliphilus TaxID=869814 RepID=UPI001966B954|nr:universal stress protein [Desulfobulbus alkaliphilus]MBM9537030.1 universal stress protein [Desulfobulbus alkaliphilus]